MDILYLLIPIALVFVIIAIRLFIWAVRSGQYDDLEMESRRILFDEQLQSGEGEDRVDAEDRHHTDNDAETVRPETASRKNSAQ